eukprot:5360575-Ditylum_brightwellii.AAC.1
MAPILLGSTDTKVSPAQVPLFHPLSMAPSHLLFPGPHNAPQGVSETGLRPPDQSQCLLCCRATYPSGKAKQQWQLAIHCITNKGKGMALQCICPNFTIPAK